MRKLIVSFYALCLIAYFYPSFGQFSQLPIPDGKILNFENSNVTYIVELPHSSQQSYETLGEEDFEDFIVELENPIEEVYYGQPPMFCQAVQYDKWGNILFFIVDNNIFNASGQGFAKEGDGYFYLHEDQEIDGDLINRFDYASNSSYIITNEICIIPVQNNCYRFLIIYGLYKNLHVGSPVHPRIFYRYLDYIDNNTISMTEPEILWDEGDLVCNNNLKMFLATAKVESGHILLINAWNTLVKYDIDNDGDFSNEYVYDISSDENLTGYIVSEMEIAQDRTDNILVAMPLKVGTTNVYNEYLLINFEGGEFPGDPYSDPGHPVNDLDDFTNDAPHWHIRDASFNENSFPKGLEFSPNADYLYFTRSSNSQIGVLDVAYIIQNSSSPVIFNFSSPNSSFFALSHSNSDFSKTQLEIGKDNVLYMIDNTSDNVAYLLDPDDPDIDNLYISSDQNYQFTNVSDCYLSYTTTWDNNNFTPTSYHKIFLLADQIDKIFNNDYFDFLSEECCNSMTFNSIVLNENENYEIWYPGPGNNPFDDCDGIVYIDEDFEIPVGKVIEIHNMTFAFSSNKKVILRHGDSENDGSRLKLYNTTFTSNDECGNTMWTGVVMNGNGTQQGSVTSTQQPVIQIFSGSVIENAFTGIFSSMGGIIQAENCTFRNNVKAVQLQSFFDFNAAEKSRFINCDFITDGFLNIPEQFPKAFVTLTHINDVKFKGCHFINTRPIEEWEDFEGEGYHLHRRGSGIVSCDAIFRVLPICDNENEVTNASEFSSLYYGIHAYSQKYRRPFTVDRSEFTFIYRCVLTENNDDITFTRNELESVPVSYIDNINVNNLYQDLTYCLYLNECTGYDVRENYFHDCPAGVFVTNSGITANIIYNNFYEDLDIIEEYWNFNGTGLVALETNGFFSPFTGGGGTGLEIKCNDFVDDDFNIAVIDGVIKQEQGENIANENTAPAGNTFQPFYDPNYTEPRNFFVDYPPTPEDFYKYYYHESIDQQNQYNITDPVNAYSQPEIRKDDVPNTIYLKENACNILVTDEVIHPYLSYYFNLLRQFEYERSCLLDSLDQLVDNGNTLELLFDIQSMSSESYYEVKEELLNTAPFTSDTVLIKFLQDNESISSIEKTEVLIANSPLSNKTLNEVNEAELDSLHLYVLSLYQEGMSAYTQMRMKLSDLSQERQLIFNEMMHLYFEGDTLSDNRDSIYTFLDDESDLFSKFAFLYLSINDTLLDKAEDILDEIELIVDDLNRDEKDLIEPYLFLPQLKIDLMQLDSKEGRLALFEDYEEDVVTLAEDTGMMGRIEAQLLIREYGDSSYTERLTLPEPDENKSISINPFEKPWPKYSDFIKVTPNPATEYIDVDYVLFNTSPSEILIYSQQGICVNKTNISKIFGHTRIQVNDLPPGIYYVKLGNFNKKLIIL